MAGNENAGTGATEDPGRLRTFGRWAENAGNPHTFGRWEEADGNENAGTGATEGPGRLRTFSEGGKGRMETETWVQALQKALGNCAPSEGGKKRGKSAHLRKVGRGGWKRKRGHRYYRGSRAIAHLRKVSRNVGNPRTFGRWEGAAGNGNAGTGASEGPGPIAHLRKVSRKRGNSAHLRKVGEGRWKRKRGHRRYRGSRAITHLRKVGR